MRHALRLILVFIFATSAFAAAPVADLVRQHEELRLGEAKSVAGFTFSVGHMNLALASGTVTPVLAGETAVGLFLTGSGTFTYETVHRDELTVLRYNARHADVPVQIGADKGVVKDTFSSVLLRGTGLPQVSGAAAAAPEAAWREHRQLFAQQTTGEPAEHLLLMQQLNAPSARMVRAYISGARPYVHVYDDAWTRDETLALLRRTHMRNRPDSNWLYTAMLSKQAIGRPNRKTAPPNVMLTDLDVTLVNTAPDEATLTVVETLVPQRPVAALVFSQYRDYIYDLRREPRRFRVRGITDEQGNKLSFHHDRGSLLVGLAQPAPAGKAVKLRFEIDGNFLVRPEGSNYWELGIEPWFPMLNWNEMSFTYHALLKVQKPFAVFTSGKTVRREEEGAWNVVETRLEQPVAAVAILAGRYHWDEETRDGLTVRVASFMSKNPGAYKTLRNITFAAAQAYPRFLGPFPFDEITIIERNDLGYGQAPAGIIFITKEAFTPTMGDANYVVEGVNRRLAHEIAHMYWGHVVKMDSAEGQWIDEAFAEYSAALMMKAIGHPGEYDKALAHWKADAKDAAGVTTIPMANRLVNFADPYGRAVARQGLIYAKGALLLAALHRELGDTAFLTFLKSYQKSFRWKHGTTGDVIGLLQFMTEKDYAPFFEQYFYGTAVPDVARK